MTSSHTHQGKQLEIPTLGEVGINQYILNVIRPLLYYRFNELSGSLIDYGSEAANGVVSGATQGQTGQLGLQEAYLFDGVDDIITIANADIPNLKAVTTQRWAFLVNATSEGESNLGVFSIYGTGLYYIRFASSRRIAAGIDLTTTDATAVSNVNQFPLGTWVWLFVDYDDADSLGNGRKIRLFKGTSGTLTQLTLGTDTAGVGTVVTPSVDLFIGNRSVTDWTFDGLMDIALADSGLWTNAEMQQLIDLSGV